MKSFFFIISIFFTTQTVLSKTTTLTSANSENPIESDTLIYAFDAIEKAPEFPGGSKAMMEFISSNINYPKTASDKGIEGTVTIKYVIEKDGSLTGLKVVKEPGGGLGEEAIRVFSIMPAWKPGSIQGRPVRVQMVAPVRFKLTIPVEDNVIYTEVDKSAQFPGGQEKMLKFIKNERTTPAITKNQDLNGASVIFAIVEKDGSLSNLYVQEKLCPECDEEALRIVAKMPAWTPAILKQKPVRSVVLIPVSLSR